MNSHKTRDITSVFTHAFDTLKEWRHLPSYQLERRLDIFFGLALPNVIRSRIDRDYEIKGVIPEFPLHKGLVLGYITKNNKLDNRSVKVDFAVFCRKAKENHILLVEFKTDNNSINKEQLEELEKTNDMLGYTLLEGVIECALNSDNRRKYAHLIWKLYKEFGCIENCDDLEQINLNDVGCRLKEIFERVEVTESWKSAPIKSAMIFPGGHPETSTAKRKVAWVNSQCWLQRIQFFDVYDIFIDHPLGPLLQKLMREEPGRTNPW